ncbi:acyl-CoA dehydrogenase family protein [Caldimonas thermodepolymerans]|jgi:Acyl-CoA dehydrogenases|uniref:Acyl-CoA dehydrogenase n=1 Tax=Caldimonas thermodepolymerans TaxID=215580 RepID=A0A2S5T5E4_9BURK|nr:acyl-CoA dehydrogenase family protein [Caldimonas thermodepolymerans]PPE70159.1 acyl-CoA dehydrogenase [Caldimonas thermodepolymerans]QPC32153.1 acyl-CoA dehydrogenase family protein [Caldimonas thermodepolymerans]RDH98039.1 citronellyl-CoA dehydrogenase [Caldimonas thermodepolymerans]TCP08186.1 citronellyl-CoA dehydrogenase [Caldimonas thermodepolymerans]UZG44955.1 acyl-CoA dehydrogenase family protein [Caldimonas thermodepolymerans]
MQLTPEHEEMRRTIKRFIAEEINPYVDEWEEAEIFPAHELFRKMGKLGLLGLNKPEQFGGLGLDHSYAAVLAETLGEVNCCGVPMAIGVQTDMATPALAERGSDELRREFLAPAISGEMVACLGVSEVGSGSDVASIKTTARKDGGDYVINGGKMWTTNGTQADFCVVLANTSDGPVHKNKSLIVVPMKTKGVSVAKKIRKIGMNASDTAQLYFDEVRVPQRYRIGEEGMGFIYQMEQFQIERLWGALNAGGTLLRCIDETIEYVRQRKAFGKALVDNQWIHYKLAELKTEVESLRALTWRGVEMVVNGENATEVASMAKLKAGRLMRMVPDGCLQFWGGMGFVWESPVSRIFRDGRLTSIGGGADEVMLQIISKYMGIFPKAQ